MLTTTNVPTTKAKLHTPKRVNAHIQNKEKTKPNLTLNQTRFPHNAGASITNQWDPNARQHKREIKNPSANKRANNNTDDWFLPNAVPPQLQTNKLND